ncbi:NADPH-dependent FMN reductase [Caldibacillus debilis]|uniref:NADPH-dependent FMN reductase n=1 Tax=Caldibacillus debilis TaxID=301148 RepID=UPI0030B82C2A
MEILSIRELPFYDQDEEADPPDAVKTFKEKVKKADGVIIATPEYNWSIPGALKNALDWLSRGDKEMKDKPVMVVGASTGILGTVRAQIDLRKILGSSGLSARVLPPSTNEFLVTNAHEKFDESGRLTDEATLQFLDAVVNSFVEFVKKP